MPARTGCSVVVYTFRMTPTAGGQSRAGGLVLHLSPGKDTDIEGSREITMKYVLTMIAPRIRRNSGWRARTAGLLALATVASAFAICSALPAKASPCSPFPSCFGSAYQVSGTPDNSLWEWTGNPSGGGTAIRPVANGYTLVVGCQANNGPQEDDEYNAPGVPSQTWDLAWDSGLGRFVWVYDWWMNTPPQNAAYNWYSWPEQSRHCNF